MSKVTMLSPLCTPKVLVTTLGVKILYKTNCVIREEKLIKLLDINLAKTEQVNCI